jgi:serine/threonine protein kinase
MGNNDKAYMENSLTGQDIGKYKIGPLLGVGGMGEVYQATDTNGEIVAIKFLRNDYMTDAGAPARFIREIRIMEALEHENIMPIRGHGIVNGNMLYYTMRLINGMSLDTMMKRKPITLRAAREILDQLFRALEYGHSQSVVHRDIKPENVFIERHDKLHLYLGDFGLGKRTGIDNTLTEADSAIGTPHYMSPEAIMGEKSDPRADIYSTCVLAYEMFLDVLPFDEEFAHATAIAHVTKPVPKPTALNPSFPIAIEAVLLKGLEKTPDNRHQNMGEVITDFWNAYDTLSEEEMDTVFRPIEVE